LASIALELGGKSPVIIDSEYSLLKAAKNLAWGKYVNCGQTCVAPDYILIPKNKTTEFMSAFKNALKTMYSEQFENNPDYCQIITSRHAERLKSHVDEAISKGAQLLYGGELFDNGKMMPTILSNVSLDMKIMQEEIFGPVLPLMEYNSLEEGINFINSFDNALALYMFSNNKHNIEKVRENTSSGGFSVNETLFHVGHAKLPFGGAGKSGIGKYHGHYGFEEMSNMRSVLHRKHASGTEFFYPPYTDFKQTVVNRILKFFNLFL
jgi:aldehyde dehydrogenase (NAD+)